MLSEAIRRRTGIIDLTSNETRVFPQNVVNYSYEIKPSDERFSQGHEIIIFSCKIDFWSLVACFQAFHGVKLKSLIRFKAALKCHWEKQSLRQTFPIWWAAKCWHWTWHTFSQIGSCQVQIKYLAHFGNHNSIKSSPGTELSVIRAVQPRIDASLRLFAARTSLDATLTGFRPCIDNKNVLSTRNWLFKTRATCRLIYYFSLKCSSKASSTASAPEACTGVFRVPRWASKRAVFPFKQTPQETLTELNGSARRKNDLVHHRPTSMSENAAIQINSHSNLIFLHHRSDSQHP